MGIERESARHGYGLVYYSQNDVASAVPVASALVDSPVARVIRAAFAATEGPCSKDQFRHPGRDQDRALAFWKASWDFSS